MIINLSQQRREYFELPDVTAILRTFIDKKKSITIKDLKGIDPVVCSVKGDLEQLLDGAAEVDDTATIEQIEGSKGRMILIPGEYRIAAGEAHHQIAYSTDSLINLDSAAVKRAFFGDIFPKGSLSKKRRIQEGWTPKKVIPLAFEVLRDTAKETPEASYSGYTWWGSDRHRRIVSLYRCIQGAELRGFQNIAAYKLMPLAMKKQLRTGKKGKMELTPEQFQRRVGKMQRYDHYRAKHGLRPYLDRLDVSFDDLIEPDERENPTQRVYPIRVLSRSRPQSPYEIKVTGTPFTEPGSSDIAAKVWDVRGKCYCKDKGYRSDKRPSAQDEDFFCPHEIAAFYTLRKIYENDTEQTIDALPFLIPTQGMMDFIEKLRYDTVMLIHNPGTKRWSKRRLNHTEMENLAIKRVLHDGFNACFTTDIADFKEQGYDPQMDLIRFS